MGKIRKLKIQSKFEERIAGNITVPYIRIEGKWLESLGFKEGEHVQIEEEQGKIIIQVSMDKVRD